MGLPKIILLGITRIRTLSELSDDKRVDPLADAVTLPQHYLLELAVRAIPLLHQLSVFAELAH